METASVCVLFVICYLSYKLFVNWFFKDRILFRVYYFRDLKLVQSEVQISKRSLKTFRIFSIIRVL